MMVNDLRDGIVTMTDAFARLSRAVLLGGVVVVALLMAAPGLSAERAIPGVLGATPAGRPSHTPAQSLVTPPMLPGMLAQHGPVGSIRAPRSFPPDAQVEVGYVPWGVAFDSGTGEVFVANFGSSNVSVISDVTDKVVATIPVGYQPSGIAYDPMRGELFVADYGSGAVSVISDATDLVVATIPVGEAPWDVAYDPLMAEVFVTNLDSSNVSVISDVSLKVVASIDVGVGPSGIAFDAIHNNLYVANEGTNNVSVISGETDLIVATIDVGYEPLGVAVTPLGQAFVTDFGSDQVTVIETEGDTVTGFIPVGYEPEGIAYEPEYGNLYVTEYGGTNLTVIQASTATVVGSIAIGVEFGSQIAYDSSTEQFFVSLEASQNVTIVNDTPASVEVQLWSYTWYGDETCSNGLTIPNVTAPPSATLFWFSVASPGPNWYPFGFSEFSDAISATLYVPAAGVYGFELDTDDGSSAFLDGHLLVNTPDGYCGGASTGTSYLGLSAGAHQLRVYHWENGIGTSFVNLSWETPGTHSFVQIPASAFHYASGLPVAVGSSPGTPIYADGKIFVPDAGSASVSVISGSTEQVVANISVGSKPGTPVYDAAAQEVFVPNFGSGDVSVINASTDQVYVEDIVGTGPEPAAYDPATGGIYVPNAGSGNVTVIAGATDTVAANVVVGTDPQTPALDRANGELYVANNGSDSVSVLNASHDTVVATVAVGSEPGTPAVDPANGEIYVPNWGSDNVSVISGATEKVVATITVGGSPFRPRASSDSPLIFSRTTKPHGSPLFDSLNQEVYVPNANSSNVSVISGSKNTVVATVGVGSDPQAPVLDPANGNIYVANNGSGNLSVISGNSSEVVASIPTGPDPAPPVFDNASHTLYVPDTGSANLTLVSGSYYLTFAETGLPNASNWIVVVSGAGGSNEEIFSRTTVPTVPLGNGTVRYTVFGPAGYEVAGAVPPTASVTIAGRDVKEQVEFIRGATRSVTFHETGLAKGVSWCAGLGYVACTNSTSLKFANLTPYQYPYGIPSTPGYTVTVANGGAHYAPPPGGVVNVTTKDLSVKLKFKQVTYALSFNETGLGPRTGWTVKVSWTFGEKVEKASKHSSQSTITFEVPNGTVSYTIEPVKGYSGATSGTATIAAAPLSVPVSFSKT